MYDNLSLINLPAQLIFEFDKEICTLHATGTSKSSDCTFSRNNKFSYQSICSSSYLLSVMMASEYENTFDWLPETEIARGLFTGDAYVGSYLVKDLETYDSAQYGFVLKTFCENHRPLPKLRLSLFINQNGDKRNFKTFCEFCDFAHNFINKDTFDKEIDKMSDNCAKNLKEYIKDCNLSSSLHDWRCVENAFTQWASQLPITEESYYGIIEKIGYGNRINKMKKFLKSITDTDYVWPHYKRNWVKYDEFVAFVREIIKMMSSYFISDINSMSKKKKDSLLNTIAEITEIKDTDELLYLLNNGINTTDL